MKKQLKLKNAHEARLGNIIDMGLDFSAMIRLFNKGSKKKLRDKILDDIRKVFEAKSENQFIGFHASFCNWGTENIMLAEKKRDGQIIKRAVSSSYGQIAKILDVVLKVAVYYSHLPDCDKSQLISGWLNAAVDTKMMALLKTYYPKDISRWPTTIQQVDSSDYTAIQKIVRKFISERHNNNITPVQFDDIYWEALNREASPTQE